MANSKISALTSATTPLAGTEVLPVVQSSTTKKTAVSTIKDYILGLANTFTADQTISTAATVTYLNVVNTVGAGNRYSAIAFKDSATQSTLIYQNYNGGNLAIRNDTASGNVGLYTQTGTYGAVLSSAGNFSVTDGNFVVGTSGKGIDFSATPGTGTSELLADYEEGTWFPAYQGSSSNPTVSYAEQFGYYTKVGNVVTFTVRLVTSSVSGGSGDLRVTLPFTTKNSSGGIAGGGSVNFGFAFGTNPVTIFTGTNVSYFVMKVTPADLSNLQTSILNNTCYLSVAGYFFT